MYNKVVTKLNKYINGAGYAPELEDVPKDLNIAYCDHLCTSNCRREGCNCECGEYHNEDGIYKIDEDI